MSIDSAVGYTYVNSQISIGKVVTDPNDSTKVDYTEQNQLNPDSLYVRTVNSTNGTLGYTYNSGNSSTSGIGTVVANSTSGFVFTTLIAGTTFVFYVSNTNQPTAGTTVLPAESNAPVYQAPCYCTGTLIRTEMGDAPVEQLTVGDRLVTISGELSAIQWIGLRSYAGRFFASNPAIWPVRLRVGSLGTDDAGRAVPGRDLLVSPNHAMFVDGVLVPAELLVNGTSIVRDGSAGQVSYFHVELPAHDVIWAENAASESFVDDSSRGMFQNNDSYAAMYPDVVASTPVFCAPRVEGGEALEVIRRRLGAMAAAVAPEAMRVAA